MKLSALRLSGFRCFGIEQQTIALNDLNCLVGPNASGKTAAMMALVRLFGEHPSQRQLTSDDFHLEASEHLADQPERNLSIECRIEFPELAAGAVPTGDAVAESFNQMVIDGESACPYCRIRLEGKWSDNGTPLGDIEQSLSWILTNSDDPKLEKDNRQSVHAGDRGRIRVIYVPAARDPAKQIATTTATAFGRLLKGIVLGGAEATLKQSLQKLQAEIGSLKGMGTLNSKIQTVWKSMYDGRVAREIEFRSLEEEVSELLSMLAAHFNPNEDGRTLFSADLSDGLRSLFSLSLSVGLFYVEQEVRAAPEAAGFKPELAEALPLLTIFAVEEPENHLSPHYLGRVVDELTDVARHKHAQVVVSSHSPSILGRVQPDDVIYFLGNEQAETTRAKRLPLPTDAGDEAFKYVREAISMAKVSCVARTLTQL